MRPDGKAPEAAVIARHVLANPAYAVRYAHAAAAAVLRWAAALGTRPAGFTARLLAEPRELALLDALSWLPERVAMAARRGRPDEFAGYLEELAARTIETMSTTSFTTVSSISSERLWLADAARTGLAAGLELGSEHPLAAAIVTGAEARGLTVAPATDFAASPGKGVIGTVGGRRVAVGNTALLASLGIAPGNLPAHAEALRQEGQGVMLVAIDGKAAGLIAVADPIKESAVGALKALREDGIRVVMLTGDSRTTAEAVARKLGIDDVVAEVLPDQKAAIVKKFQSEGRLIAMAGDGINDAPALAQAHVGIAMGTGTDVAMEAAAVTLIKGDLQGIVRARRLSRATMRNIRQNLFFAFVFNALAVPIAAGVLYPAIGLLLNPMIASAAMSMSSVLVISNALRLRSVRL